MKCYVHNIFRNTFTTKFMWKVITSSNLNSPLKLFFYSPILTNNNLLLKIYCENIMVTFLNYNFLFIILFLLSQPSFHPYIFFSFFFSSTHVVLISIPLLLFSLSSSFKNAALNCHSRTQLSFSLFFFSLVLSLYFFFFGKNAKLTL